MNQLPAHLQNRQRRDLALQAVGGINSGSPAHISIEGNRFTLVDDAGNEKSIQTLYLDVCVIDANQSVSKIFFDPRIPFVPGGDNSNPPICWSDNGVGASAQASQPQNTSCQLCPHNAWGSKISQQGTKVKACTDVKKLAALVPGIDMVFLLRIPPASLKNWGKYCQTLAGHGVDLPDALTRVEFESQGVLKFTPVGYVDAPTAALTDKVIATKATDNLIGRNDRPWGGQADANKIAYAAQSQQTLPAPPTPAAQPMAPPPQPFGGQQAAPAAPFGAPSATTFGNPTTPSAFTAAPIAQETGGASGNPFGQPSTSSPTDATRFGDATQEPTTPKRTRGPNKAKADPPSSSGSSEASDGIPPFLRRDAQNAPPPAPNPTQFGMQAAPAAPDAGVQAALDAAFRLPT